LQRRIAEEALVSADAALYFCDAGSGKSRVTKLELDLFGTIANWPEGFFGDPLGEVAHATLAAMRRKQAGE